MEALPDDILLKVFGYCSMSIKKLCLVCKRFEKIITNSSELMLKMPLVINSSASETKYKNIIRSRRRYCAVIIRYDYSFSENGMKILIKFGRNIKSLEIIRCLFTYAKITKMFEILPNLEALKISATFFQMEMPEEPLPSISSLKRIDFRFGDEKIFDFIRHSKIKEINISLSNQNSQRFEDFMVNQKHLQKIEGSIYFRQEIVSCFPDLTHLNEVTIELDVFPSVNTDAIISNSTKTLNIYDTTENQPLFVRILKIFPNLKNLAVFSNRKLSLVDVPNKYVTKLTIFDCKFSANFEFKSIEMPTLKIFEYDKIEKIEDWKVFSKKHPQIQELILKPNTVEFQDFEDQVHGELRNEFLNINILSKENLKFLLSKSNFESLKILRILVNNVQKRVNCMGDEIKKSSILFFYKK